MKRRLLALLLLVSIWSPVAAQDLSEGLYRLEVLWGNQNKYWAYLKRGNQGLAVGELGSSPEAADWKLVRVAGTPYFRIQHPQDPNGYLRVGQTLTAIGRAHIDAIRPGEDPDGTVWQFIKRANVRNGYTIGRPNAENKLYLMGPGYVGIDTGYYISDFSNAIWRVTLADVAAQAARDRANRPKPPPSKWIVN